MGGAPQAKDVVTAFKEQYPNVTVNLVNAGTANDEYTKLQNAVKADSGTPDVTHGWPAQAPVSA